MRHFETIWIESFHDSRQYKCHGSFQLENEYTILLKTENQQICANTLHIMYSGKEFRVHQIIANLFRHPVYTRILSPYGNNFFIDEFKLKFKVIQ